MFKNSHTGFSVDFSQMSRTDRKKSIMKRQKSVMFSISPHKFPSKLDSCIKKEESAEEIISDKEITVNKLRIHYFFSESRDISEFANKFYMELRLLNGDKEVVAQGKTKIFKDFMLLRNSEMKAEKTYKQIIMHTSESQLLYLDVILGLACDGKSDISSDKVFKYRNSDVYYPDDAYTASCQIPEEWMEAFLTEKNNERYHDFILNIEKHKLIYSETVKPLVNRPHTAIPKSIKTELASPPINLQIIKENRKAGCRFNSFSSTSKPCSQSTTMPFGSPVSSARGSFMMPQNSLTISVFQGDKQSSNRSQISIPSSRVPNKVLLKQTVTEELRTKIKDFKSLNAMQKETKSEQNSAKNTLLAIKLGNPSKKKHKKKNCEKELANHLLKVLSPYGSKETIKTELNNHIAKHKRTASYNI